MRIDTPGKISDRIWLLGSRESCVYLVDGGGEYAIVGGGMVHIVPEILVQLKDFNIPEEKIRRIIIQHAHFDHCGIVPFFKRRWPWMDVAASARAKTLLSTPKVIETIETLNQILLDKYGRLEDADKLGLSFPGIAVDTVVGDGDTLSLGDLSIEIIDVPGHSSCSIAVYLCDERALFGSDAGGIPFGDGVFTAANSNFDKYMVSLRKMLTYDFEIYLAEHYGALTGKDARQFLERAVASAVKTRKIVEAAYAETGDIQEGTETATDRLLKDAPEGFLPREVISLVVGQMVKYVARTKTPIVG
jgi:2-aminobenzoylacetyl-CoA thioesterase